MIRTPEQYVESLRDGRKIFLDGERIPDITENEEFRGPINARAMSYMLYNHPKFKDFLTIEDVCTSLEWSQDRALRALRSLELSGTAKYKESFREGKQWFFPSL